MICQFIFADERVRRLYRIVIFFICLNKGGEYVKFIRFGGSGFGIH